MIPYNIVVNDGDSMANAFTLLSKKYGVGKHYEYIEDAQIEIFNDRDMNVPIFKTTAKNVPNNCPQDVLDKIFEYFGTNEKKLSLCLIAFCLHNKNDTYTTDTIIETYNNNYCKIIDVMYFYLSNVLAICELYFNGNKSGCLSNGLTPVINFFDMQKLSLNVPIWEHVDTKIKLLEQDIKKWFSKKANHPKETIMMNTFKSSNSNTNIDYNFLSNDCHSQLFFYMGNASDNNLYKIKQISISYVEINVVAIKLTYDRIIKIGDEITYFNQHKEFIFGEFENIKVSYDIETFDFDPTEYIYNVSKKNNKFSFNDLDNNDDIIIPSFEKNNALVPIHSFNFLFYVVSEYQHKLMNIFPNYGTTFVTDRGAIPSQSDQEPHDVDVHTSEYVHKKTREGHL